MERFAKLIRSHERFLLATHANPDGDCLGSQMALHLYLCKIGKESHVMNAGATPNKYQFIDPRGEITVFDPEKPLPEVDVVFILDTNDVRMLGDLGSPLNRLKAPKVFIDHHVPETDDLAGHLIDERYAATGELVYDFLRYLGADIDSEMALAIYVAILSDTGGFRHKRTSPKTHKIASELLQKGVSSERVYQRIFAKNSLGKMRLLGHLLQSIQTRCQGRVAWIVVSQGIRKKYRATIEDTEAFINQLTHIDGIDIGIMFREEDDGSIKVSLRGIGEVPVIGVARKFGGGGHRHAAGMRVSLSLEETVRKVGEEAERVLTAYPVK